jgi:hypothetical protein
VPANIAWMDRHNLIGDSDADEIEDRLIAAQRQVLQWSTKGV